METQIPHLPAGTVLNGRYHIERFIGAGGFGCTYEARHIKLGTRVAVKEFFAKDFCNRRNGTTVTVDVDGKRELVDNLKRKFEKEALALHGFHHENIVRVSDVFDDNQTIYYVMDYIEGRSLADILKQRGPLPEQEALGYIHQVASALDYVHQRNHLHLDVKPANVMVDAQGRAILIDFGAAKHYDEKTGGATSMMQGIFSPGYAPFEQETKSVTTFSPSTDIYSLGATFYKLLTGVTPPRAVERIPRDPLRPLPATITPATRRAIERALAFDREERPQSIADFLRLLDGGEGSEETHLDNEKTEVDPEVIVNIDPEPARPKPAKPKPVKANTAKPKPTPAPTQESGSWKWILGLFVVIIALGVLFYPRNHFSEEVAEDSDYSTAQYEIDDPDEQFEMGQNYYWGNNEYPQDYSEAVDWYRKAAEQGNADAQCCLGVCYENGQGVVQDYSEAVKWYRKSAEQGNAYAQCNLGLCYDLGQGVTQSYSEAAKWYRKSAEQGIANAQCNLGVCYVNGQGVTQSYSEAAKWYRKSAEQGDARAQCNLGDLYYFGNGVAKSYSEAVKWFRKAAEQGYDYAQFSLGYCYEYGQGVTQSDSEAAKWYRKAAARGNESAKERLRELGYEE